MYTLIKQVTIKGTSTADVIAKSDSLIALHRQMVATYNTDITKYTNYMYLQIDEQMSNGLCNRAWQNRNHLLHCQ